MKKFFQLPRDERILFFQALSWSYWIWFIHHFYSYNALQHRFRCTTTPYENLAVAKKIRKAIRRSGRLTFWKNKCLIQSFVARKMLNKRGVNSRAFLGMMKNDNFNHDAHAWVESSGIQIIQSDSNYTILHEF